MPSQGVFRAVSVALVAGAAIMLSGCGVMSAASSQQSDQHAATGPAPALTRALRVADKFLEAWSDRNANSGIPLLSSSLKKSHPLSYFRSFFVGLSNPHNESYEIGYVGHPAANTYVFRTRLYYYYTGMTGSGGGPPSQEFDVVQNSNEKWMINSLPHLTGQDQDHPQ